MTPESALTFRNAFREARLKVLANAENYQELLFVLERLGTHLAGKDIGLAKAKPCIMTLVQQFPLARSEVPSGGLEPPLPEAARPRDTRPPRAVA